MNEAKQVKEELLINDVMHGLGKQDFHNRMQAKRSLRETRISALLPERQNKIGSKSHTFQAKTSYVTVPQATLHSPAVMKVEPFQGYQ